MDLTRTQKMADALLRQQGTDLVTFVTSRAELDVPGAAIARQLAEATGDVIVITDQAMRDWIKQFRDEREPAA